MRTAQQERHSRQAIYWVLEEDTDIDPLSLLGQYIIDHYRPEYSSMPEFARLHHPDMIQAWADEQWYMEETP